MPSNPEDVLPRMLQMLSIINGLSHDPDAADLVQSGQRLVAALEPLVQVQHVARRLLTQQTPAEPATLNAVAGTFQLLPLLLLQDLPQSNQRPLGDTALSRLPEILVTRRKLEELQNSGDGEAICAICHDDYEVGKKLLRLPCAHVFCVECGRQWLRRNNTCPVCRNEVPDYDGESTDNSGWHSEDLFPFRFPQGSPLAAVRRSREAQENGSVELWPPIDDMYRITELHSQSSGAEQEYTATDFRESQQHMRITADRPVIQQRPNSISTVVQDSPTSRGTGASSRSGRAALLRTNVPRIANQPETPPDSVSRTVIVSDRSEHEQRTNLLPQRRHHSTSGLGSPNVARGSARASTRQDEPLAPLARVRGASDSAPLRARLRAARDEPGSMMFSSAGSSVTAASSQRVQTRHVLQSRQRASRQPGS